MVEDNFLVVRRGVSWAHDTPRQILQCSLNRVASLPVRGALQIAGPGEHPLAASLLMAASRRANGFKSPSPLFSYHLLLLLCVSGPFLKQSAGFETRHLYAAAFPFTFDLSLMSSAFKPHLEVKKPPSPQLLSVPFALIVILIWHRGN